MKSRALVFDLYGQYFRYRGGEARLGVLTRVMGVFGVEPATVRTTMTRLRKEGWFTSSKSGREVSYGLNDRSWNLLDNGRSRIFERWSGNWDQTWTQALVDVPRLDARGRKRVKTALSWWGFGTYRGIVWFSPHDRAGEVLNTLAADDHLHVQFLRSRSGGLPSDRAIAEQCWDLGGLSADYQRFIEKFRPRLGRYRRGLDGRRAVLERMELIQEFRRYPFRDPDLPVALLPSGWRGGAAHELFLNCRDGLRPVSDAFIDTVEADM